MSKNFTIYLNDIREAINSIEIFVEGMTFEEFKNDDKTSSAVIRKFRKNLHKLIEEINNYNQIFIEKRLKNYSSFLDGKDDGLKYPLDEEQRLAVIKDDKHNLVIAGADFFNILFNFLFLLL